MKDKYLLSYLSEMATRYLTETEVKQSLEVGKVVGGTVSHVVCCCFEKLHFSEQERYFKTLL